MATDQNDRLLGQILDELRLVNRRLEGAFGENAGAPSQGQATTVEVSGKALADEAAAVAKKAPAKKTAAKAPARKSTSKRKG